MNKLKLLIAGIIMSLNAVGQDSSYQNSATRIINSDNRLSIRGYAEINYNQPIIEKTRSNGQLEVQRMVLFTGYKFSNATSFIAEIEIEHGNEIYLEQAFLHHRLGRNVNLRAGLLLIPMGIVNEYHEPTTFNGVERPMIDQKIVPTTWRELGIGFQGILPQVNLSYQLYMVNGFKSYNNKTETGLITATGGFRSGRQKGVRSIISSPNLSAKLDYFGLANLKIGLAGYIGKTQSPLYNGINIDDEQARRTADSSVLGLKMIGIDGRYVHNNLEFRGQGILASISNHEQYNAFTNNSIGAMMYGYYVEAAMNVLPVKSKYKLLPFLRYSQYDTQVKQSENIANMATETEVITAGLTLRIHQGVSLKADIQQFNFENSHSKQFNAGVGIWF